MTEDTEERMERAERIRQLRQRGDPGATDAGGGTGPGGAHTADGSTGEASRGGAAPEGAGRASAGGPTATTGVELPDRETVEAALAAPDGADADPDDAAPADADRADETEPPREGRDEVGAPATEARSRVLEFDLGDELFCIDIADLEEIVKRETVTRVPNTPSYVEGVVDLRGQITTILDAKDMLDMNDEGPESLIVVFSPEAYEEYGAVGWVVDEVRQVRPVTDDQVRAPPADDEYVEGVVDREDGDELVVWIRPEAAMAGAVADDEAA